MTDTTVRMSAASLPQTGYNNNNSATLGSGGEPSHPGRAAGSAAASSSSTATMTITEEAAAYTGPQQVQNSAGSEEVLRLTLSPRPTTITWSEGTVDNEHLGRKSSKRCCFADAYDSDDSGDGGCRKGGCGDDDCDGDGDDNGNGGCPERVQGKICGTASSKNTRKKYFDRMWRFPTN